MKLTNNLLEVNNETHIIVKRDRLTNNGQTLCEEIHIYFSNREPKIIVDREFAFEPFKGHLRPSGPVRGEIT